MANDPEDWRYNVRMNIVDVDVDEDNDTIVCKFCLHTLQLHLCNWLYTSRVLNCVAMHLQHWLSAQSIMFLKSLAWWLSLFIHIMKQIPWKPHPYIKFNTICINLTGELLGKGVLNDGHNRRAILWQWYSIGSPESIWGLNDCKVFIKIPVQSEFEA